MGVSVVDVTTADLIGPHWDINQNLFQCGANTLGPESVEAAI